MAADYKQYNYSGYTYSNGPFSQQACGPCAVADIVNISPLTVAQWLTNNGYSTNKQGTSWYGIAPALTAFGAGGKTLGTEWNVSAAAIEEFKQSIKDGYEGVLCMGAGTNTYWTSSGHYICVCGYKNGEYLVHDPASSSRTGWHPWSDFEGNVKCAYTSTKKSGSSVPVDTYTFTLKQIKEGDTGKEVTLLQKLLFSRDLYPYEKIDGSYGPRTRDAVITYQKWINSHGGSLKVDGVCGPSTWQSIIGIAGTIQGSSVVFTVRQVKPGDKNVFVYLAQELLKANGLYLAKLDMDYGPATETAVREYQRKKGIAVDGICGPTTFRLLIAL